jgi:sugar/nucleoside kinase (ribokinase family)
MKSSYMEKNKITVSGTGCCLIDRIYNNIDFNSDEFSGYISKCPGDGGLILGGLEFEENFENFTGDKFPNVLAKITHNRDADSINIGGPCIVALINAAQLSGKIANVCFYGCHGDDVVGEMLNSLLKRTPIDTSNYRLEKKSETASTTVFSDPEYDEGHGERIFVNTIGASWKFLPSEISDEFYKSDITVFGATAIVPQLHDNLDSMLVKAKQYGSFTVVNTVFDSRNERLHPGHRWPMGGSDKSYNYIDLLITDKEEALHLSGMSTIAEAMAFFQEKGVGAAVVTNGAKNIYLYANEGAFKKTSFSQMPVCEAVSKEIKKRHNGDTTGCGDNFAGGMIFSIASQMYHDAKSFDIIDACRWGVVSGGFACFYVGGTFYENTVGEKFHLLEPYYNEYLKQI